MCNVYYYLNSTEEMKGFMINYYNELKYIEVNHYDLTCICLCELFKKFDIKKMNSFATKLSVAFLCRVYMFSLFLHEFSPGSPVSSHSQKRCMWGNLGSKLWVGVSVNNYVFSMLLCGEPATFPGSIQASPHERWDPRTAGALAVSPANLEFRKKRFCFLFFFFQ